ncbi:ATP-binding protein [Thermoflexus sp.]|uniref:ATP-binding protein n=1 Tax=Thermoflexus sp. TaxID=1969742 RepID=UPI002ADD37BE|nr:DUF87 domain-containing protein [Thermoflexus sp.]
MLGYIGSPVEFRECPVVVEEEIELNPGAMLITERGYVLRVIGPRYDSPDHDPEILAEKVRMRMRIPRAEPRRTGVRLTWVCEILGRARDGRVELGGAPAPGEEVRWADPADLISGEATYLIGRLWPEGGELRLSGISLSQPSGTFGDPGTGKTYKAQTNAELFLRNRVPVIVLEMSPDEEYSEWARRLRKAEPEIPVHLIEIDRRNPIPIHRLRPEELLEAAGVLTRDQEDLLVAALADLSESPPNSGSNWTREDLYRRITDIAKRQNRETVGANLNAKLRYRMARILTFLGDKGEVFDPSGGGLYVFRLARHPYRELTAAVICTLIEEAALSRRLPGGVVLIDEAHLIVPADRDIPSRHRVRYFVRLARHLGIVPWLISQSPRSIDRQVFDLLRFLYIFALSGENLAAVRDRLSGLHPRLIEQIPLLPTGVCVLVGPRDLVPFPLFFRAEGRRTEHPSPTRDIFRVFEGAKGHGKRS